MLATATTTVTAKLLRKLQIDQAQYRNREGGYWIAETDPAAHALVITIRQTDATWAVIATDGAFDLLAHLRPQAWSAIADSNADQLGQLLQYLRDWERNHDPGGQHLPRAKRHDDKCIAICVGPSG